MINKQISFGFARKCCTKLDQLRTNYQSSMGSVKKHMYAVNIISKKFFKFFFQNILEIEIREKAPSFLFFLGNK